MPSQVPNQFKVPVAVKDHSSMDLTARVTMSHDFGVLNPIMSRLMVPGDKFEVNPEYFTYLAPLPCPTFGDISLITRAFFVPFRILFEDWKEFISNNKVIRDATTNLQGPVLRFTDVNAFTQAFTTSSKFIKQGGTRKDIHEVSLYVDGSNIVKNDIYHELTYQGRQVLSVLRGLGYNIPFVSCQFGITQNQVNATDDDSIKALYNSATKRLSLLPLVAFWRMYLDWIVPSRFVNNHPQLMAFLKTFKSSNDDARVNNPFFISAVYGQQYGSKCFATSYALQWVLELPTAYLPDDFFTTAFQNEYGYESQPAEIISLPTTNPDGMSVIGNPSYGATASEDLGSEFNMFTLRSLGALQDLINRGKVAGTKIQDYLRVTYGIEPGSSALDLSTYLGFHSDDINIGSVSSNADTFDASTGSGASLGQFAGRGLGGNKNVGQFSYEAKEHGLFILTCELVAKSSYWQGLRPECDLLTREDFFQPEFDAMGCEAIPYYLLNFAQGLNENDDVFKYPSLTNPKEPFGYCSTYARYKVAFDSLLGDFRVGGLNTGMDSWYLARFLGEDGNEFIDENFSRMVQDNTSVQYDHIFQLADNSADHFYTQWKLHCKAYRPMIPLEDVLEFEDKSGKQVTSHFNGAVNS